MNINIRTAIIDNFKSLSKNEIYQTIEEATTSLEEKTLPGLGVFLELIWKHASADLKNELTNQLLIALKK